MRVLLDANVFASGVLGYDRAGSTPGEIVRRWRAREFTVVASDHLIGEVVRTLADPFFTDRIAPAESASTEAALKRDAQMNPISTVVSGVATHPEDDLILAAAVSAAADFLFTGDRQLLKLGAFGGVAVISPAEFLAVLSRRAQDEGEA